MKTRLLKFLAVLCMVTLNACAQNKQVFQFDKASSIAEIETKTNTVMIVVPTNGTPVNIDLKNFRRWMTNGLAPTTLVTSTSNNLWANTFAFMGSTNVVTPLGMLTNNDTRPVSFAGTVTGEFLGDGGGLIELDASQLAYGYIPANRYEGGTISSNKLDATAYVAFMGGSGAGFDTDAQAYITATGTLFSNRVNSAFLLLKNSGLWSDFVDGAVLGSQMNVSNATWRTLMLRYGTNIGNPVISESGVTFNGTQFATIRGLPQMQTNTLIATFDQSQTPSASTAAIALQNSSSVDGLAAITSHPTLAYMALLRSSATDIISNQLPYWSGEGYLPRMPDEHTVSMSISPSGRFNTIDGYTTNTVFPNPLGWQITPTLTSLNIGAVLTSDSHIPTANLWKGRMKQFMVFNRQLNTNEVMTAMRVMRWLDPREDNYVFVGDSLTVEYADGSNNEGPTQNWPYQFMNAPANTNKFWFRNFASGSQTTGNWLSHYNGRSAIAMPGEGVRNSTMMVRLGANDLLLGVTMSSIFDNLNSYCTWAKSNRFRIELMTQTPITNYVVSGTPQLTAIGETNRLYFNAMLATNRFASKVWPIHQLFTDMTVGGRWSPDGVHSKMATDQRIAAYLLTGELPLDSRLDMPAFGGDGSMLTGVNARVAVSAATPSTYVIDFATADTFVCVPSGSAITFSTANLTGGRSATKDLIIRASATPTVTLTFPSWTWLGTKPTSMTAGQAIRVELKVASTGASATDADVVAYATVGTDASYAIDGSTLTFLTTVVANGGTVTTAMTNAVDAFVKGTKSDGDWNTIDHLWVPIGGVSNAHTVRIKGSGVVTFHTNNPTTSTWPTHDANGVTFYSAGISSGGGGYAKTGYNPATFGGSYTLDSARFAVWVSTNNTATVNPATNSLGQFYFGGAQTFAGATRRMGIGRNNTSSIIGRGMNNSQTGGFLQLNIVPDHRGLVVQTRTDSTTAAVYFNNVTPDTDSTVSEGIPSTQMHLGDLGEDGASGGLFSTYTCGGYETGGGLDAAGVARRQARWNALGAALNR